MAILRFFFGSGWWVLWYLAFYAVLLVFVVMCLVIFGQEARPAGEKPNLPSPGSIMVFMITLGLGAVTLANGLLLARVLALPWYVALLVPLMLTGLVLGVGLPLN